MNPVFRFLYWNMNYHVEHHMFPMVPYHALPRLHEVIKADLPAPYPSCWAAYREIIPAFLRQVQGAELGTSSASCRRRPGRTATNSRRRRSSPPE